MIFFRSLLGLLRRRKKPFPGFHAFGLHRPAPRLYVLEAMLKEVRNSGMRLLDQRDGGKTIIIGLILRPRRRLAPLVLAAIPVLFHPLAHAVAAAGAVVLFLGIFFKRHDPACSSRFPAAFFPEGRLSFPSGSG